MVLAMEELPVQENELERTPSKMRHSAQGNLILKLAQLKMVEAELTTMALHIDGMRQTLYNNEVVGNLNDHFESATEDLRTLARWTKREYEGQLADVMIEIDENFDRLSTTGFRKFSFRAS